MRSPLAPVLASIFIGFHESKWLNEYDLDKPKFNLATSKTWTQTLDPGPEPWTLDLDPEKPGP